MIYVVLILLLSILSNDINSAQCPIPSDDQAEIKKEDQLMEPDMTAQSSADQADLTKELSLSDLDLDEEDFNMPREDDLENLNELADK